MVNQKIIGQLFEPPTPIGSFKNYQKTGDYIYVSGQGPFDDDGNLIIGKIGENFDVIKGYDIARRVGLTMLSVLHEGFGEGGIHSRSAVGVFTLPNNIPVEIEGIFKLK